MFFETFGKVTLKTVSEPKRGFCLEASTDENNRILMDVCGLMIPDGTNAYFFGNKLILVTRWGDMTDDEKNRVQNAQLVLAIHPSEIIQFSMKVGAHWGDVMLTLPHCYKEYNDVNSPVDEIIFIFNDRCDADEFMVYRRLALPPFLQKRLQKAMASSYAKINLDDRMTSLRRASLEDESKDEWDYVYDVCWRYISPYDREARKKNFEIPDGIYITIDSDNKIKSIDQNSRNANASTSDEVKMYLELAENGSPEAEYNLGFCYANGDGVEKDLEKSVYWYKRAAERGYHKAQLNLGLCYHLGNGVEVDLEEAFRLFSLAADQGNMYALFNMGVCYAQGLGVESDYDTAMEYMRRAAEKGHPEARKLLKMD